MARDPGEWYEEKRREAEVLEERLAGARAVLAVLAALESVDTMTARRMHEAARAVVAKLERALELARYVAD